jgi:hypothetical protein
MGTKFNPGGPKSSLGANFIPVANFTPGGPKSSLGAKFIPVANFTPGGNFTLEANFTPGGNFTLEGKLTPGGKLMLLKTGLWMIQAILATDPSSSRTRRPKRCST